MIWLWRWDCEGRSVFTINLLVMFASQSQQLASFPSLPTAEFLTQLQHATAIINAIWKSQKCGMFLSISKKPSPHHSKLTQTHHDLNRKIFQISILGFTVFKVWNVINTLFTHDCFGFLLVCSYQRYHLPPDRKQRSRKFVINWPRYVPHWSLLTVKAFCNWGDQYSSTTRWI